MSKSGKDNVFFFANRYFFQFKLEEITEQMIEEDCAASQAAKAF